jgi:hypothetical protein
MWKENCIISPGKFIKTIQKLAAIKKIDIFTGYAQNDLPEFLLFLIECFHISLSREVNMTITGTSFNGSAAVTAAVDATNLNTASKVVARDASGNFAAGTITATLTGSATSLASLGLVTAETLTADAPAGVSFRQAYSTGYPTT